MDNISESDRSKPAYLPGDGGGNSFNKREFHRLLRVDHAGEYGAVRIYQGQIKAAKSKMEDEEYQQGLTHMLEQEKSHLDWFDKALPRYRTRPTALMPVWDRMGFGLGWITAKLGKSSAMACTVAVETEIEKHYQRQIERLDAYLDDDNDQAWSLTKGEVEALKQKIIQFREEELEHHDYAHAKGAQQAPLYPVLKTLIGMGARAAIAVSKKI